MEFPAIAPIQTPSLFVQSRNGLCGKIAGVLLGGLLAFFVCGTDRASAASFSVSGTTLQITLGTNETLGITSAGSTYGFALTSGFWSGTDGGGAVGNGTSMLTATAASFTLVAIGDSGVGNTVNFNNSGSAPYTSSFSVTLDNGTDGSINFPSSAATSFVGNASLAINTSKLILVNTNASLSIENGNLTCTANTITDIDPAIEIKGNVTTSGSGNILFTGIDSNAAGLTLFAGSVKSTGTGPNAGTITLNGTSTPNSNANGVTIDGVSLVSSVSGNIVISGAHSGSVGGGRGVSIATASTIASTGTGSSAANISVTGTGGIDTISAGVYMWSLGGNSGIAAVDGNIQILGIGRSSGSNGAGVDIEQASYVRTTGKGSISIQGTATGASNNGILLTQGIYGHAMVEAAGTGGVSLSGSAAGTADIALFSAPVGSSSALGSIVLAADSIMIDSSSTLKTSATGSISFAPRTAGTNINLGGSDASGVLGLSAAEMARVQTGILRIGSNTTPTINLTSNLTLPQTMMVILTASTINLGTNNITAGMVQQVVPGQADLVVASPSNPSISDGGTVSFGNILQGSTADVVLTIKNPGFADLTGLGITIDGAHASEFSVIANPTAPVSANGSTSFTVRHSTILSGAKMATLHIASNAAGMPSFDILLTASSPPDIAVEQPVGISVNDGASQTFGFVTISTSADLVFTIKNPGLGDLTGLNVTLDGANAAEFTLITPPSGALAPGGGSSFTIRFTPTAGGTRSAALHIASSVSGAKNPYDISLSGVGITGVPLSGTKSIGPTGDYLTIADALTDVQGSTLGGPIVLELQPGYTGAGEVFPVTFGNLGTSQTKPLTLRPQSGATGLSISSGSSGATVDLNGAAFVTIDGRPSGLGNASQLAIAQTTGGAAVRFVNEAHNNTLQHLTLRGISTSTTNGVLWFSNTTGANGNDNNLIDHCNIADGASKPSFGIYSAGSTGTASQANSNNTISNCNIFNFSSTSDAAGIRLDDGNTDWTIDHNSFYGALGGSASIRMIYVNSPNGNNFQVTRNFLGGSAASASGSFTSYSTASFVGIHLNVGTVVPSSVQSTTLRLIGVSTSGFASTLPGIACGIYVQAGAVDVSNNTIGATISGLGVFQVLTANNSLSGTVYGIGSSSPGTVNISNNIINGVLVLHSTASSAASLVGIQRTAGNGSITGNLVGSTTQPSSLDVRNSTSSLTQNVTGIGTSSAVDSTISNNTIANLNNTYGGTGSAQVFGITTLQGGHTVSGNTIHHLSTNSLSAATSGALVGINISRGLNDSPSQGFISRNLVYALSNTNTTSRSITVNGTSYSGLPSSPVTVMDGNFVHSLSVSATGTGPTVNGMSFTGKCVVQNNMICLGVDENGASTGVASQIHGLYDRSSNAQGSSFYHNSVFVGGTQMVTNATFAFQSTATGNPRAIFNNIFVNARSNGGTATGGHFAVIYAGTGPNPSGLTADHNIFFVGPDGALGSYGGTKTDLASWQAATGVDANSIVGDPLYANATGTPATLDLHLQAGSPARHAGVAISGITTDIDSDSRNPTTPDIGADELGQPEIVVEQPSDTGLLDGVSTVDYGSATIGGTAVIKIFNIRNLGTTSLTGLSFTIDGAGAGDYSVSPTSSTPLAPNETGFITVTFSPSATGLRKATLHIMSNDFDESSFDIALSGIGVTGISAYQQWAQANGVSNDPSTSGSNGVSNLINFGFAINPGSASTGPLVFNGNFGSGGTLSATGTPITRQEGADLRALFVRRKDYATVGLTYTVQFSAGLSSWQDSTDTPTVLADDGTNQIVSVPYPAGFTASGFFRVSVTLP